MDVTVHPESLKAYNASTPPAWPANLDNVPPSRLRMQQEISLDEKISQGNSRLNQMRRGIPLSVLLDTEEENNVQMML